VGIAILFEKDAKVCGAMPTNPEVSQGDIVGDR